MNPTIPGLITVAGLLSTGFYLSGNDKRTLEAFAYFFLTFCSVNAAHNMSIDPAISGMMYAIPAFLSSVMTLYLFRKHLSWPVGILSAIYLFNVFGEWLSLDIYKILGVDILDILVWIQLGLLVSLAHKSSVEIHGRSSTTSP